MKLLPTHNLILALRSEERRFVLLDELFALTTIPTHISTFLLLGLMQVKRLGLLCNGTQSACLEALMMLRGTPGTCSRTAQQGAQELPALMRWMGMLLCQHSRSKLHLHFQVLVMLKWAYKTVIARHGILGS